GVDQDVTVVGLDLGGIQDQQAVAVLQLAEVALQIELAVLGEHDAVERSLGPLALQQLQVRLDRRPAVIRALRVQMQIENHATGRSAAGVTWGGASSNATSTAAPMRAPPGGQPTMVVMMRGPSASSTIAST